MKKIGGKWTFWLNLYCLHMDFGNKIYLRKYFELYRQFCLLQREFSVYEYTFIEQIVDHTFVGMNFRVASILWWN